MLLSLCVLTALCTGSSGGQWEDLYWSDPLHWEMPLWGDTADQRSGKGSCKSSWRTLWATEAGDWWSEEERCWAGAVFTHCSHLFPSGNPIWKKWSISVSKVFKSLQHFHEYHLNILWNLIFCFSHYLFSCLCRVSSLTMSLLLLRNHLASLSVLVSLLMIWEFFSINWKRNWSMFLKKRKKKYLGEVKYWH